MKNDEEDWSTDPEEVEFPISDELDLHTFSPKEIESLLEDYFMECRKLGIPRVRVVHGKGSGAMRERVHRFCKKSMDDGSGVIGFVHPAAMNEGSWGATWVLLAEG